MFDSTQILTKLEIAAIRKRFDNNETALNNLAIRGAAALFSDGRELVTRVGDLLYGQREVSDFIEPIDREVQLLTLFTISREWPQLAIHCYWALLVRLSPHDIATTLLLASLNAGIDEYVSALGVMTKVMYILKKLAPTEPSPEDVLGELQKAF